MLLPILSRSAKCREGAQSNYSLNLALRYCYINHAVCTKFHISMPKSVTVKIVIHPALYYIWQQYRLGFLVNMYPNAMKAGKTQRVLHVLSCRVISFHTTGMNTLTQKGNMNV